jgi:putative transposase
MPRLARIKDKQSIYHIMIRSIKEVDLFETDDDKEKYLSIMKKYIEKYHFKVYAYCLLDNHGHLMIDANGADISRIMHSINFSYAQYFNREHKRHGHLFQDRFKSKIVEDERYLKALSSYIHNNPKDIVYDQEKVKEYPFSSLRDYIHDTNHHGILDKSCLGELLNLTNKDNMDKYLSQVAKSVLPNDNLDVEFEKIETEYRSQKVILARTTDPQSVIEFVAKYTKADIKDVYIRNKRKYTKIRAISCFLMNCFCNIDQKYICRLMGNITQSRVSKLCNQGLELAYRDLEYKGIIEEFIKGA